MGQLGGQPGAFPRQPALHALVPGAISHQGHPRRRRQAVDGPGVPPGGPAGQAFGIRQGIAKPQPRNRRQFGQAADHHQAGAAAHPGQQRLGLTAGHQRQKSLIHNHQRETLQQGHQGLPAPELASRVVGIGDPQHGGSGGGGQVGQVGCGGRCEGLGEGARPAQGQGQGSPGSLPASQSPLVIGETRHRQQADAGLGRIAAGPGEQLGGAIAGQHHRRLQAMALGDRLAQRLVFPVGIIPDRRTRQGPPQAGAHAGGRTEGHQGGTGFQ